MSKHTQKHRYKDSRKYKDKMLIKQFYEEPPYLKSQLAYNKLLDHVNKNGSPVTEINIDYLKDIVNNHHEL